MKFNWKFAVIFVTLLLISKQLVDNFDKKRKMLFDVILKKYGAQKASILNTVYDSLIKAGVPGSSIKLAIAQVMHETGVLSGKQRASKVNNFSGITYSGSPQQKATGAKKSNIELPEAKGTFYASYDNPVNWAKDYVRILSKGAEPIKAQSPANFAYKLKLNKYYTAPLEDYTKGLTFFYNFLTKAGI
jgi:hypothetical protein